MNETDHYTHARIACESLDVFCGQFEDEQRSDPTIGYLLAGVAQARATLALADRVTWLANLVTDMTNAGRLNVSGLIVTREDRP